MYKSDVYTIDLENGSVEDLILAFCKGTDIVFVTLEEKFYGGVTRGDIVRQLRFKGENVSLNELINTRMKCITYLNEEQALKDAEAVFEKNKKIHNVPVIDKSGKLLFQINRTESRNVTESIKDILVAVENNSVEVFLKSDEIKEIIITGADSTSLHRAKNILDEQCRKLNLEREISIRITNDVSKCCLVDNVVKVISLSDLGAFYINKNTGFRAGVVSAKDLVSFYKFSEVEKLDKSAVTALKNIFGYEKVVFCSLNRYLLRLKEQLEQCGIQVCQIEQQERHMLYDKHFIGALDVFCFQGKEEYCEDWNVGNLIEDIECLWRYKQITGCNLTCDKYMERYIDCLRRLEDEGYEVFLHEIYGEWEQKLDDMVKEKCGLQVINEWGDMLPEKNYIIARAGHKQKSVPGKCYLCSKEVVLQYTCEYAVYKRTRELCKNVYVYTYTGLKFVGTTFPRYDRRTRDNYLENKEMFPDNFVKDMYGDDNYPVDKVIQDRSGCQVIKINDGYVKFSSNYHSQYFNTDTYGRRVVVDTPLEYSGTIWLVGHCCFSGYAVEDRDTFASYLQTKVNASSYSYRVINLSCDGIGGCGNSFNRILESDILPDDIVILFVRLMPYDFGTIKLDAAELNSYFSDKIWYWNAPGHSSAAVYEFMAEKTFKTIKKDMINNAEDYQFYVEKNLESKIYDFIAELKNRLKKNPVFLRLMDNSTDGADMNSTDGKRCKAGAIVMNCNPFTFGHQYLIETAARIVEVLYVFVVEEDKSTFRFADRFRMVQDGTKQYGNVIVVPSGEFMISAVTFPGYFLKDAPTGECYDAFLDLKIFAHYVAPALGISMRFVGEEPFDRVTAQYNRDMKTILKDAGIDVIEIPRKRYGSEVISATKVRALLEKKDYVALKKYIPETTTKYVIGTEKSY